LDWVKEGQSKGVTGADTVAAKYMSLAKEAGHKFPKEWKTQ